MSIFGSIMSAIFGTPAAAAPVEDVQGAPASGAAPPIDGASASVRPTIATPVQTQVDVAAVLDAIAAKSKEKNLEWRKSIVDLMKLIGLDSSLNARKKLAQELKYSGDMKKSAEMNVWLHKQVMTKLAESGGKVPDDLKS